MNRKRKSLRSSYSESLEPRLLMTDAPQLSSLPGASKTLLIDFDGHKIEDSVWNIVYQQKSLVAKPYNIEGGPASFSAKELLHIEEAWSRISEDFAPFRVNVTTVDPGPEVMAKSGIRCIVTAEATMVTDRARRLGVGGMSIDSWGGIVMDYGRGGKSVAENASHEIGHSLGLRHDGQRVTSWISYYKGHGKGETGWGPIMGLGFSQNVTQWDDGAYYGATNKQDDLLVMSTTGGLTYREDDHGNSNAEASILNMVDDSMISDKGIIEMNTDIDVFSFVTNAGEVVIDIKPFTPGPNLDIKADLYDSEGTLILTSDSITTLSAQLKATLEAGEYFIHVDGVGFGSPAKSMSRTGYSDYGSLGRYFISGLLVAPTLAVISAKRTRNLIDDVFSE